MTGAEGTEEGGWMLLIEGEVEGPASALPSAYQLHSSTHPSMLVSSILTFGSFSSLTSALSSSFPFSAASSSP